MGNGFNFTKKEAEAYLKVQLQKLNVFTSNIDKSPCQVGQMSADRTQATLADGSTVDVQVEGIVDDFMIICNGVAYKSDVPLTIINNSGGNGYVAGYNGSQYYIRNIGSATEYIIDTSVLGFDPSLDLTKLQIKISQDGKCFLIGGFYQDLPPASSWNNQLSGGSGGCQGNCFAVPGYSYHTLASWAVYSGFSLGFDDSNPPNPVIVAEEIFIQNNFDLTAECQGKITPPTQNGLGSASIYKLFPTASDITPSQDNAVIGDDGNLNETITYGVDVNGNPPDARFYPAVNESYTWSGYPFVITDFPFPDTDYSGLGGTGQNATSWSSNGDALPLLLNATQVPIAIKDASLLYVFSVDNTGTTYTVDIVSDISFGTIYKVDSVDFNAGGAYNWVAGSEGAGGNDQGSNASCTYGTLSTTNFTNTVQEPLYAYLSQFYNSQNDEYIVYGNIAQYAPSDPNLPSDLTYANDGVAVFFTQDLPPQTEVVDSAMSLRMCYAGGNPCEIFRLGANGFGAGACRGPTLSGSCDICFYVSTTTHTVLNWDGSSVTVLDDFFFQGLGSFFNTFFAPTNCCNSSGLCCEVAFGSAIYDPTYQTVANANGFFSAYRFGRGTVSFANASTVSNSAIGTNFQDISWSQTTTNYTGPAINVGRLSSHSNQNQMWEGYRGINGNTALVYLDTDPYVPAFGPDLSFRPFSGYYYATPYISEGLAVNPQNPTPQGGAAGPPDAFTDAVLSGYKQWPFPDDLEVKGLDSYVLEGYSQTSVTDPVTQVVTVTEIITLYGVDLVSGLTTVTSSVSGTYLVTNEKKILDFIYPVDPTAITS